MRQLIIDWIFARASEPSTWRGVLGLLTGMGVMLSPEYIAYIVAAGSAGIGAINVVRKEQQPS